MKIPISWLREYVEVPDVDALGKQLTAIGHMQDGRPKEVAGDVVLDLEIRQNRSDCYSILGIAREAAAVLEKPLQMPSAYLEDLPKLPEGAPIEITDPSLCYRFSALYLENVKVAPSPEWLRSKLDAYGIKSINNVVDVTNFVMLEIGEPLHAFDRTHITGDKLIIRPAKDGEKLKILGGRELTLTPDDLVVADAQKAITMAGIIGGENSGISNSTTTVLLEAATYNQANIRCSALRHDVRTEASTRHEKFLHPDLTQLALKRAAKLLIELAGAELVGQTDVYPAQSKTKQITLRFPQIRRLGGINIPPETIENILDRLGIPFLPSKEPNELLVIPPIFRTDLEQEADIVEEILRLHGYDRIPERLPNLPPPIDLQSKMYTTEEKVRDALIGFGYDEIISEPLTHEDNPEHPAIHLENSLTSERDMLRTTMRASMLHAATQRQKHRQEKVRVFEVGKIYFQDGKKYSEPVTIGVILAGKNATYRELKGVVESLFAALNRPFAEEFVQLESLAGKTPTYFAQIALEQVLDLEEVQSGVVRTSPPQLILEDISMSVPAEVKVGELLVSVRRLSPLLYRVELGEEPREMEAGRKSIFLNLAFHSEEEVLQSADLEPVRAQIKDLLRQQFEATIR